MLIYWSVTLCVTLCHYFIHTMQPLATDDLIFAIYQGQLRTRGQLWADVLTLVKQLPDHRYVFNLCENRYAFCVCLLAAVFKKQTCLLPPSQQTAVLAELRLDYADSYVINDAALAPFTNGQSATMPEFDWQHPAVIAFTSGSSAKPKPCTHSLKTFAMSAQLATQALGLNQPYLMMSTTPPQHMYGLETSVFWALFSSLMLYDGRPFFPEDIRQSISNAPYPVILSTTPAHLRSLSRTTADWSNLAGVISATDHLSATLAQQTADSLGRLPYEIYGSTETLSFAYRHENTVWQLYPACQLESLANGQTALHAAHLTEGYILQDALEVLNPHQFKLLGRNADLIKIAGKRISLTELNQRLQNIEGVEDGVFFLHAERLNALVVSSLTKTDIRSALSPYLDAVFLPRHIYFVPKLPRNETGKLTKAALAAVLGFELT